MEFVIHPRRQFQIQFHRPCRYANAPIIGIEAVRRRFDFFREEVTDAKIVEMAALHYCTNRPEADEDGALNNIVF